MNSREKSINEKSKTMKKTVVENKKTEDKSIVIKGRKIEKKAEVKPEKKEIRFSNLEETVMFDPIKFPTKKKKKKFILPLLISLFSCLLICGAEAVYFVFLKKDVMTSKIIGKEEIVLNVFKEYKEQGLKLKINKEDMSKKVKIKGKVNTKKIGDYELVYMYEDKILAKRKIKIIDTEAPKLTLTGEKEVVLLETADYIEKGATAMDNYDKEIKVETEGEVDTKKVGEYEVKYIAKDSSNNQSEETRKIVIEEKPKEIIKAVAKQEVDKPPVVNTVNTPGQIKNMVFTNNGIKIEGCGETGEVPSGIAIGASNFQLNISNNCYSGNIDLSSLPNGTYPMQLIVGEQKKNVVNKLDMDNQISRGRVGNKLASFDYSNSNVSVTIGNFGYEYDVVIDVGHGGYDSGAVNKFVKEKDMNLIVSEYEKSLYEAQGFRVLLTRTNDSYGPGMGPSYWPDLRRRSYYMGYYGAVSKVMYSNHHNGSTNANARGFQMYVSTKMSNMQTELNIYNQVGGIFKTSGIYTRDYWTGNLYSKAGGQYYDLTNYYAVLRVPADLFNNNQVTIYEGSFLSNTDDHIEYWLNEKWKSISKIKVDNYIARMRNM